MEKCFSLNSFDCGVFSQRNYSYFHFCYKFWSNFDRIVLIIALNFWLLFFCRKIVLIVVANFVEFDERIVLIIIVLYSTILNFKALKIIRDDKRVSRTKFFITVTLFLKLLYLLFLKHYAASTYM